MLAISTAEDSYDATNQLPGESSPESLRAAALLTLKSKRRKINTASDTGLLTLLPVRPVPVVTDIQLDYGQAESTGDSPTILTAVPTPAVIPTPIPKLDDEEPREEGEISDSEDTEEASSMVFSGAEHPWTKPASLNQPSKEVKRLLTPPPIHFSPPSAPRSIIVRGESVPPSVITSSPSVSSTRELTQDHDGPPFGSGSVFVRPGLAMDQARYDSAKDIILDLLGWGVPPEYLASCGLSREIIYFVFLDLNLRLPNNLDISGFPTFADLAAISTPDPSHHGWHTLHPPARPVTPSQPTPSDKVNTSQPVTTPQLPLAIASSSGLTPADATPSLHDMEQQRRQQLLARKAALASRKSKLMPEAVSDLAIGSWTQQSEGAPPIVPEMAVDDFLNSIRDSGSSGPGSRMNSMDEMDVDSPTPGLPVGDPTDSSSVPRDSTRSSSVSDTSSPTSGQFGSPASTSSIASSIRTVRPSDLDKPSNSSSSSTSRSGTPPIHTSDSTAGRRGTKRPVAADFVDMEPGPRTTNVYLAPHSLYHHHHHHNVPRKKASGFAGITMKHRRVVIDLSDSEDEDDDLPGYLSMAKNETPAGRGAGKPGRVNVSLASEKSVQLEREIQAMKEMIAKKQQEARLRKLEAASGRATPTTQELFTVSDKNVAMKQEDDEGDASVSLGPSVAQFSPHLSDSPGSSPTSSTAPSTPALPIGPTQHSPEIVLAGNQVANVEWQEQAVVKPLVSSGIAQEQPHLGPSHVDAAESKCTSSAQVSSAMEDLSISATLTETPDTPPPSFIAYRSPLSPFPLLRAHSPQDLSEFSRYHHANASTDSPGFYVANSFISLKPLKVVAVSKVLLDPSSRICQYEVPGGGECRDRDCTDTHLSTIALAEPSDEETANYLASILPANLRVASSRIEKALEDVRQRSVSPGVRFEARVAEALASLGIR